MNKTPKSKAKWEIALEQKRHEDSKLRERLDAATGDVFNTPAELIARMEANQARFGSFPSLLVSAENERRLQLQDRKPSYWDRIMSDPNRKDRYDDALLEAHMEAQRQNEEQGAE